MITETMSDREIRTIVSNTLHHYIQVVGRHHLHKFKPTKFPAEFVYKKDDQKNNWEVIIISRFDTKNDFKKGKVFVYSFLKVKSLEKIRYYTIGDYNFCTNDSIAYKFRNVVLCYTSHLFRRMRERNIDYSGFSDLELIDLIERKAFRLIRTEKTKHDQDILILPESGVIYSLWSKRGYIIYHFTYISEDQLSSEMKKEYEKYKKEEKQTYDYIENIRRNS